jgi:beta-carotene 15,15'-dioxygenase
MAASSRVTNAPRELCASSRSGAVDDILTSDGFNKFHASVTIFLFSALIVASVLSGPIDLWDYPVSSALIILVLGVPHGACDVAILKKRWHITTAKRLVNALTAYLALVILTLTVWRFAPTACLGGFLLMSAFHFASDWPAVLGVLQRFCVGGALLASTTVLHRSDVGVIFGWLTVDHDGLLMASAMQALSGPLLVASIIIGSRYAKRCPVQIGELAACIVAAVILPPLTFFVAYFCCLHSVRHLMSVRIELADQSLGGIIFRAAPYAAVAVIATIIGGTYLGTHDLGHDMIAAVFIGLAALTVPHMALVDQD